MGENAGEKPVSKTEARKAAKVKAKALQEMFPMCSFQIHHGCSVLMGAVLCSSTARRLFKITRERQEERRKWRWECAALGFALPT